MNTKAIFVGDVVEENGKTVKENNLEKQHTFPVGSLVEVLGPEDSKGLRLFVMRHSRDCDGSPLYALTGDPDYIDTKEPTVGNNSGGVDVFCRGLEAGKRCGEWGGESLRLIHLPDGGKSAINISIAGNTVSLEELKQDLQAAVEKGFNHDFAFTVHTVRGLIEKIEELS